ncbi:MAG TPA: hypothetical protein VGZ93_02230 [Candidatus Methylacidiphilales bacterium]|jgi:hypothetical protein|nr:hypothetical protein [Candidatus Methylacidiphilales bacterium]
MRTSQTLRHLIGPIELIHEQAGGPLLIFARFGIFALWIVKLLLDPLWRLAEMLREFFQPVGILALLPASALDALLRPAMLGAFLVMTIVVCGFAMFQRWFPLASTLAAILLTAYSSLIRSFGPAVHTDIVLLLAVYALAGFAWADLIQDRFGKKPAAGGRRCSYPLVTIVAMLCLSYCLVGLNRTVAGGISVFTGDTMEAWAVDAGLRGYYFNTDIGWRIPEWPLVVFMLRSGLPVITFFEITAPLCLVWPRYRWIFIPVMLSFHLLSLVLMNIFFFDDMLLYLLLVDWSRRFPALRAG